MLPGMSSEAAWSERLECRDGLERVWTDSVCGVSILWVWTDKVRHGFER